jgi:hypothetical protein
MHPPGGSARAVGGIISERWATSSRNGERHHFGRAGGITPERRAASSGFRNLGAVMVGTAEKRDTLDVQQGCWSP